MEIFELIRKEGEKFILPHFTEYKGLQEKHAHLERTLDESIKHHSNKAIDIITKDNETKTILLNAKRKLQEQMFDHNTIDAFDISQNKFKDINFVDAQDFYYEKSNPVATGLFKKLVHNKQVLIKQQNAINDLIIKHNHNLTKYKWKQDTYRSLLEDDSQLKGRYSLFGKKKTF